MHALLDWLKAGSPPHYLWLVGAAILLVEDLIARSRLASNSTIQLVASLLAMIPGLKQVFSVLAPKGPSDGVLRLLVAVSLGGMLVAGSGCACWKPADPAYSSPRCVVARAVVQCGSTLASEALAQLLVAAPQAQWSSLLDSLKGDASPTVGCLLANLAPSLAAERRKLGLTDRDLAAHLLPVARVDGEFAAWKSRHGFEGVRFCYSTAGGQVCR